MGQPRHDAASHSTLIDDDVTADEPDWPFGRLEGLDRDELRETAYEIFFASCRSSPGFAPAAASPRQPGSHQQQRHHVPESSGSSTSGDGKPGPGGGTGMMTVVSRVKRALGLRTRRSAPTRPMSSQLGSPLVSAAAGGGGGGGSSSKPKRPMTSAEIMRRQMGVTEQSDARLRKTLARSLVGQMSKRVETIILPLELLRHVKPSDFGEAHEYHQWQRRQLKILEAGLLLHPSVPLDRLNSAKMGFNDIMLASEHKPIDTTKNSEAMRALAHYVMALAWTSHSGAPMDSCHWADGYPLNIHLYLTLLHCIFDVRDETVVLDEVDELLELIKRTWSILGINRMIHNVCFTWILFDQYIATGQVEPDLINATLTMLVEVGTDAKSPDREPGYVRVLSAALASMQGWAEKKLLDYHEWFDKGSVGMMENVLCLALSTAKITTEDASSNGNVGLLLDYNHNVSGTFMSQNCVEHYIRSSVKCAFTKVFENGNSSGNGQIDSMIVEVDEDPCDNLMHLAKETEKLASLEKETYSSILKRWHPAPNAIAVLTLHNCFAVVLKKHITRISGLTNQLVRVLQTVGKLEKMLVKMALEESADCEDGGKSIMKEMIPFEVESIIMNLLKSWIHATLRMGREFVNRAKDTESWNPKSKSEPYAQSAVDLMKLAKGSIDKFLEIKVAARDEMVQDLLDGLDSLLQDYTSFVAACGSKQSYLPKLPPLTRCNQDSKVLQFWKKAATPCKSGMDPSILPVRRPGGAGDATNHPRPTASRGTQRLYVRLNTLHYVLSFLHSIEKSLSFFSRSGPSPSPRAANPGHRRMLPAAQFELTRSSVHASIIHIAEVAAYRLIFHDSAHSFYDALYMRTVAGGRIRPTLRILKQNLSLLSSLVNDQAQALVVRELMKASFECFTLVLLAGGSTRAFTRSDHDMVAEDFMTLKRLFCTSGEGLVSEEVVEKEAAAVAGVVSLMSLPTDKLVQEFSFAACEASGLGRSLERVPMPATTGKWGRSDPNTMLRVLCHRNDDTANRFLKRTFDLPRRN